MREALASLTRRGLLLLTGGATAAASGVMLGLPALAQVGLFACLLPLLAVTVMGRARYQLTLHRDVAPQRLPCGQSATVTLKVTNDGFSPPGTMLVEDTIGYALGSRPRFRLGRLARGESYLHEYRVSSDVRGLHELGPAVLRVTDPLGLVEIHRGFRSTNTLVVLPPVVKLPAHSAAATADGGTGGRDSTTHRTTDDATVRAYRRGDDVRRVHWRSSARLGELMVRQAEHPHRPATTVLLDVRSRAHRGNGVASSFETAVQVAASVLVHLHTLGHDLRLVAGARQVELAAGDHETLTQALELLAEVTLSEEASLPAATAGHREGRPGLITVVGHLAPTDTADLAAWSVRTARSSALAVTPHAQLPLPPGWVSAEVGPRTPLAYAWVALA